MENEIFIYGNKIGSSYIRFFLTVLTILILVSPGYSKVFSLHVSLSYFHPSDKVFEQVYGGGLSYGFSFNARLWKQLIFWVDAEYFNKKGKTTFTQEDTKIQIIPITAGIKYHFLTSKISPYAGIGIGIFNYKEINAIGTVKKGDLGFTLWGGFFCQVSNFLIFYLEGSYCSCKIKLAEVNANLGGYSGTAGLGFAF